MPGENFKTVFKNRLYSSTIKLIKLLDKLPKDPITRIFIDQLIRSASSIIANYIEAQAASSRKDFTNFIHHSLKSANESKVWLEILKNIGRSPKKAPQYFLKELKEIATSSPQAS